MGAYKKDIYTEEQAQIADIFKALSNPARLAILENLMLTDNKQFGGLVNTIDLSPSTISYHIQELSSVGLLGVSEDDKKSCSMNVLEEPLNVIVKYCNDAIEEIEKEGLEFEFLCVAQYKFYIKKVKFKES
jgi:DNA-binding transcriptional ArsR family regulator